ncbi:nucleotidyltransferase [Heyndrickxia acidiproducens]|uniref:nucleotidyltransferase n=1 Tax=Heyndrickxia acidiproducens TaxID=1121084 RepID=UPI0003799607|nr:nucleotidyltransferase [Heyndrickxia acidiproducens]
MISTGVVVEYNPFHNGHLHHIREARRITGADVIIAVMSGNFLQRGEPALVPKWARAQMALEAGVDLIVELPYAFAVQQAEIFAGGAVAILNALQCRNFCFGSEAGEIGKFEQFASLLLQHEMAFNKQVRLEIKKGISYPAALTNSLKALGADVLLDLTAPNNILGLHYMLAAMKQHADMKAYTIARKKTHYHDTTFASETFASATAIRDSLLKKNDPAAVKPVMPETTYSLLEHYQKDFGTFHHWGLYWPFLQYKLLSSTPKSLRSIYEVEEGIEYRLQKTALHATGFTDFINGVKTKRYTWTRIQRICTHILTNTTKTEMEQHAKQPEYIRLLAMNGKGRAYLNSIKKRVPIPVISKFPARFARTLELDSRAAQIYALALGPGARIQLLSQEYSSPPIIRFD